MQDFKDDYYSFQEGAKRFDEAMKGIPDRVPVYAQMHEFAMNELGIPPKIFYTTPEIIAPATLEVSERYGIDVGFVDYDVYNIEVEALGQKVIFFEDHMPDQTSDLNRFLPLHPLEFRILLVLLDGPAHGYRIVKEIETREKEIGSIYPGNLYRRIRDLLAKGLLEEVSPPRGVESDPRRKYFGPTGLGEAVARAEGHRLRTLVREAEALGVIPGV